jgi:hypothetical protein
MGRNIQALEALMKIASHRCAVFVPIENRQPVH